MMKDMPSVTRTCPSGLAFSRASTAAGHPSQVEPGTAEAGPAAELVGDIRHVRLVRAKGQRGTGKFLAEYPRQGEPEPGSPGRVEELCLAAGFRKVTLHDLDDPTDLYYEVRP